MNRLTILCLSLFLVSAFSAKAQTMQRESLSSSGTSSQVGNIMLSETVGQPYGTINGSSDEVLLRQGFQQPVEYSLELIREEFSLLVFPNPATYQVTMKWENVMEEATVQAVDINGKLIRDYKIFNAQECSLDCTGLASGVYILSLSNKDLGTYSTKLTIVN